MAHAIMIICYVPVLIVKLDVSSYISKVMSGQQAAPAAVVQSEIVDVFITVSVLVFKIITPQKITENSNRS